jgi:Flp pilus assembly protein TadB
MKRLYLMLFLLVYALATPVMASDEGGTLEQIEKETGQFHPDAVGKQMEQKAEELMGLARSGSTFYVAVALVVFLFLLIGGLFSKKLIRMAFYFLFVAAIGYLVLNFWPEIRDVVMALIEWLFTVGDTHEIASGV